ncbi:MAG: NAD-dependent epimerase/dehydratase family protein [Solirubrobacterales bacterium]
MRVLVTGATGKVGNALTQRLVARGDHVVALARDPAAAAMVLPEEVEIAHGDVTDPESLRFAAAGVEAAFNCMGVFEQWADPDLFNRVNAEGARNVAAASREAGAKRLVHTSTIDVFDAPRGGTVTEARVATYEKGTAYERSKQLAERLLLAEAGAGDDGIEVVMVNPAAILGPGPWAAGGIDDTISELLRGRMPFAPPGGMSMTWVGDAADAHIAALERGTPGERYLVTGGYASVRDICRVAVEEAGRGRVPLPLPERAARALSRGGEVLAARTGRPPLLAGGQLEFLLWEARADSGKARSELGIEPLDWREAVRRTTRWILESGRI